MRAITTSMAILCVAAAFAQTSTQVATNNSTIKPAGPRAGVSNTTFFNVEGSTNGANASVGVMDWSAASFGLSSAASINSVSVSLVEANAAFTAAGTVHFYFSTNTAASINNDGTSTLTYGIDANHNANGVDNQLGSLIDLGTGTFNTTGNVNNGTIDTYSFTVSAGVNTYVKNALNSNGTIRLVIAGQESATPGVAATWGGYANATATNRPSMTINATPAPEPASVAAISLGLIGFIKRRNRK